MEVSGYNCDSEYKPDNLFLFLKVVFDILYRKFYLDLFLYATSTFVCFSLV